MSYGKKKGAINWEQEARTAQAACNNLLSAIHIALICTECGCVSFNILKSEKIKCCCCGNIRDVPQRD